ncbi:MAG TPA: PilN domain-containing protein [candidate division Zixibacteria bacterium]|nr:PilN domain-containing protein [candidate division Zixibacteria bacterium]
MIEINLLPKEYQKKSFNFSLGKTGVYAIGAAACIIVMLIAVTFYQRHQISQLNENIDRAQQRAAMLRKDIQVVDALTDVKAKITQRMTAVERLDHNRSVWVRIFEEIARDVPEFVWLAQFNEVQTSEKASARKAKAKDKEEEPAPEQKKTQAAPTDTKVQLEGHAFTLNALAAFMINMMRSDYFDEVELLSTSEVQFDEHRAYKFVLRSDMHFISDEVARGKVAQADQTDDALAQASHKSLN